MDANLEAFKAAGTNFGGVLMMKRGAEVVGRGDAKVRYDCILICCCLAFVDQVLGLWVHLFIV